jgi:hypothetical protein
MLRESDTGFLASALRRARPRLERALRRAVRQQAEALLRAKRGNCYAAAEALYHILGGKRAGWTAMVIRLKSPEASNTETHWYLRHKSGLVIDPSRRQFNEPGWWPTPDYSKGRATWFLTKRPSKRAKRVMEILTWHE